MSYVASGRATSDPDFREFSDGATVCIFRLASSRRDRCGNAQTEWFTVRTVADAAVVARALVRKGMEVTVSGTLRAAPREAGSAQPAGMLIDAATVARASA